MNIISFDIEEWFIEKYFHGARTSRYNTFMELLDKVLEKLKNTNTQGTFFCVGAMAREFPEVILKIDNAGHEIGCHSDQHTWLNKMSMEEVQEDTHRSVDSLCQCIGKDVISYRAPAFTIGKKNPWTLEILYNNGIRRDSSIFPVERDFGGFSEFETAEPTIVSYNGCNLKEFPISLTSLLGKEMVYSGGGYFRFFPYGFIKQRMQKSDYAISYFHLNDLLPEKIEFKSQEEYEAYFKEKGTILNRWKRYFKTNFGKSGALNKMNKLIENMEYVSLDEADKMIDWGKVKSIDLK